MGLNPEDQSTLFFGELGNALRVKLRQRVGKKDPLKMEEGLFFKLLANLLNSYPIKYKEALEKYIAGVNRKLNPSASITEDGSFTPEEASYLIACGKGISTTHIWQAIRGLHGFNAFYIEANRDQPNLLNRDKFDYDEMSLWQWPLHSYSIENYRKYIA